MRYRAVNSVRFPAFHRSELPPVAFTVCSARPAGAAEEEPFGEIVTGFRRLRRLRQAEAAVFADELRCELWRPAWARLSRPPVARPNYDAGVFGARISRARRCLRDTGDARAGIPLYTQFCCKTIFGPIERKIDSRCDPSRKE